MRYKVLSQNIKKFRKKLNLTQKELGEKIYKSEISIRKYESGKVNIPVPTLSDICLVFGVSPIDILGSDIDIYYKDNGLSDDIMMNLIMDMSQKELEKAKKAISESDRIVYQAKKDTSDLENELLKECKQNGHIVIGDKVISFEEMKKSVDKQYPALEAEIAFLSSPNVEKVFNYSFDDLARRGGYQELLILAVEKAIKNTLIDIEDHIKKGDIFDGWGSWISKESPAYEAIKKVKEKNNNDNKPSK